MKFSRIVAIAGAATLVVSLLGVTQSPAAAQAPVAVLASDFEDGTSQGWFGRGSAQVAVSNAQAQAGESSLLVTGRADTWQGPGRDLREVLQAGVTYQIEAFVRLADADSATLHMTMQRTPTGGDPAFERVASDIAATGDEWVRVVGSYSFASEANDELQLYFESPDPAVSFYLDSVSITSSELPVEVLVATDFEDGTAQGWGARGPAILTPTEDDAASGGWSLLTTGRTDAWHGPSLNLTPYVEPGTSYGISFALKLAPGAEPAEMFLSLQAGEGDAATFTRLASATVTADEWVVLSTTWTPTSAAEAFHVYAENGSIDDLSDFYLDDFSLTGIAPPEIEDIPPLQDVLAEHFPIGAAIDPRETAGASAELLTRHFNSITAENDMKPEEIQPVEGTFTWEAADSLVAFADLHDLRIYGHTLLWHSQTPDWFFQDAAGEPLSGDNPEHRALLLERMETHIAAIADRYGDRMWAWDVVNEAIDESQEDGLRRSPWFNILGPEYLDHAFQFAREHFGPDVKLYLNDFNTEFPAKREAMFQVVSGMLDRGVPVDGVGHQLHMNLVRPVSLVEGTLERFSALPVEQAVTELDVSISQTTSESLPTAPPDRLVRQGYYFRDLFEILRAYDDVLATVTVWGLHDGRSWLRTWPVDRPHEAPLFFDDQLQSKPAYWGVVDPDQLPHFPQARTASAGTPEVDGERELLWNLLPGTTLVTGGESNFQVRWDESFLYVLAEVADPTVDAGDAVELYVDDTNAKAGDYQPGDAHYTVGRDGTVAGGGTAEVSEIAGGYLVEAALPLATPGALARPVGFDLRVTDGSTGDQLSWSDQSHTQDTDTSRWGTLTLIEAVRYVDIPYASAAPAVDGEVDEIWDTAAAVRTEVLVEGSADGAKADVRLLWDEGQLYVLAEVADPQLDAGNSNPWEQDSIEIFVDPLNSKSGAYQAGDGQYRVSYENHQTINGVLEVIGDNLASAAAVVDGGYVIEATIALNTIEPAVGSFIGLEFQVNDATDGGRTAVHTWHDPSGQSFQDSSRWGVGRLVAAPEEPGPTCDETVTGHHFGRLTVGSGTLCLAAGATVLGSVKVQPGASLIATGAQVIGVIDARAAETVVLSDTNVLGPVTISGSTGEVSVSSGLFVGPVRLTGNHTGETPIVVSGNQVIGLLACTGNEPAPVNGGTANAVLGVKTGQCRNL